VCTHLLFAFHNLNNLVHPSARGAKQASVVEDAAEKARVDPRALEQARADLPTGAGARGNFREIASNRPQNAP